MGKWKPKTPGQFFPEVTSKNGIQAISIDGNGTIEGTTYTIDDVVNKLGCGMFQFKLTVLSGLAWMADVFEIIILSVLGQMMTCDWNIVRWQNVLLTSTVFASMMLGSPIFGILADKFGRRTSLLASLIFLFIFGAVSAASPSYVWMLVFRAFTGIALGGLPQVLTICFEYFPTRMRGRVSFFLSYFWAIGTTGIILLSWGIMVTLDSWRTLLAVAALPALIVIISVKWYPESARYYVVSNQYDEAVKVLKEMAHENKRDLPEGRLLPITQSVERGRICDLLSPGYRTSTLLLWLMWIGVAFSYYGIALASPLIVQSPNLQSLKEENQTGSILSEFTAPVLCVKMTQEDYIKLLWISAAEIPGIVLFTFVVELLDRKILMFISFLLSGFFTFMLLLDTSIEILRLVFVFIARAILVGAFEVAYTMTAEAFPTTLRAVAMGTGTAWCRFGALICPYVSQILLVVNPGAAICTLGGVMILTGIAAALLPVETRGKKLMETPNEE